MSNVITIHTSTQNNVKIRQIYSTWPFILIMLAFIACFLLSVTPLARAGQVALTGNGFSLPLHFTPFSVPFLTRWGQWLPADLHLASNHAESIYLTSNLELLVLLALAFLFYILFTTWLLRRTYLEHGKLLRTFLWIGAIVAGLLCVVIPGMASKDLFVYADYGNMVWRHGGNPYFTTPYQVAPHDILTIMDAGWSHAPSAYGPVWIAITMLFSLLFGPHPLAYFYAYRAFGLMCHLVNIWLIGKSLRMVGRSERIVLLGMALYAWNPLALFENAFGAHNDAFMSTLILCGIYLSIRAAQRDFTKLQNFVPALIALTLAVLVKFTSLPLIIFFLLLLARNTWQASYGAPRLIQWRAMIIKIVIAGAIFAALTLILYLPFWLGHSIGAILKSFSAPPSSINSENSLMRVAVSWWQETHGGIHANPLVTKLASILQSRQHWNQLDALAMVLCVLVGAWLLWREPSIRTFLHASIGTLAVILLVTPWFYSWYVIWLVAQCPLLLISSPVKRASHAILAFCLVFSASAFAIYIDFTFIPIKGFELGTRYLLMIVPPLTVLLLTYVLIPTYLQKHEHRRKTWRAESSSPESENVGPVLNGAVKP